MWFCWASVAEVIQIPSLYWSYCYYDRIIVINIIIIEYDKCSALTFYIFTYFGLYNLIRSRQHWLLVRAQDTCKLYKHINTMFIIYSYYTDCLHKWRKSVSALCDNANDINGMRNLKFTVFYPRDNWIYVRKYYSF